MFILRFMSYYNKKNHIYFFIYYVNYFINKYITKAEKYSFPRKIKYKIKEGYYE